MPATYSAPTENLALLYQAVLTAIVRLQNGRMRLDDLQTFRKMTENLFDAIRKEALARGYSSLEIEDADCAAAALLDETVEKLLGSGQRRWAPLRPGADDFFDRLNALWSRGESNHLADLLEVYQLCLLLGYEGPYTGRQADLDQWKEQLRVQIEGRRMVQPELSPRGRLQPGSGPPLADTAPPGPAAPRTSATWKIASAVCFGFACVSWIAVKLFLNQEWHGIAQQLIRP